MRLVSFIRLTKNISNNICIIKKYVVYLQSKKLETGDYKYVRYIQ
jgi:hypothetical protein